MENKPDDSVPLRRVKDEASGWRMEPEINLVQDAPPPPPPRMNISDILFVIFRHKGKIALCALAGVAGALGLFFLDKPVYRSEAKIFIKYVQEARGPIIPGEVDRKSTDPRGDTILNTEMEILTSFDLAREVAAAIGPGTLLGGGSTNVEEAAAALGANLTVGASSKSPVVRVTFQNGNPEIVRPVLTQVINTYQQRHAEVHRNTRLFSDKLTQETDQFRARLATTEDELRKLMERAGVLSLEEAKKHYAEEVARIGTEIMTAEAEFAERSAMLHALAPPPRPATDDTENSAPTAAPEISSRTLAEYRGVVGRIETLRRNLQDQLLLYTPENAMVRDTQAKIAAEEQTMSRLEQEFPALRAQPIVRTAETGAPGASAFDLSVERLRLTGIETRIRVLKDQLVKVQADASALSQKESAINDLRRRKDQQEEVLRIVSGNLEAARANESIGVNKDSNIAVIQEPTPPARALSKLRKLVAVLAVGGFAGGVALAFALEMFIDQSVKRSRDIELGFRVPLFLSIPRLGRRERRLLTKASDDQAPAEPAAGQPSSANGKALAKPGSQGLPWAPNNPLRRYFDALRDRLVLNFEIRNLTRKPKLVAVTSCDNDSGASTVAAGLAASLSEIGDGNVLLVNMNSAQSAPQYFHRGNLKVGLAEMLEDTKRDEAQVSENLFVVSHNSGSDVSQIIPKRFTNLVPKFKASVYDYIIFDLPAVSQISVTPHLARYMDTVLMVVEAEKTNRDVVQRAVSMLSEATSNLGIVLNKTRSYLPRRLQPEV